MKEELRDLSKKNNIDLIGFCNIHDLVIDYDKYKLQEQLNYKCSFQVGNIHDKDLTSDKYECYNTAIVIGIKYSGIIMNDEDSVYVSSCSQDEDYHLIVNKKLNIIGEYLERHNYKYKCFVDNNPLDERLLAYNAGLGFYGKNNLLINEELGSFFFIGVILTDAVIEKDKIVNKKCINCNLCIKNCPTKALNENGILNANRCLSYLTSKKQADILLEENINNCIYGCDKCISVCPYNKGNFIEGEKININDFLNMSEEEFKEKYKNRAFYWRGKKVLDRNIKLYINSKK